MKDGGSAFPEITTAPAREHNSELYSATYSYGGMSLRDYFAAAALTGLLASTDPEKNVTFEDYSKCAFNHADAMLAERAK